MAYGGVAQTYCRYKLDGEPFKEDKAQYIYVLHPVTKARKKVRWYTDAAHAALMPQKIKPQPIYKLFFFETAEDTIIAIKEKDLTKMEIETHFAFKWRMVDLFGGIWFAPKTTEPPPVKKSTKFFYPTWTQFHAESEKLLRGRNNV